MFAAAAAVAATIAAFSLPPGSDTTLVVPKGLNLRTPFGTLLRADLGKSFLPKMYSGSGSFVAQIMILKPI